MDSSGHDSRMALLTPRGRVAEHTRATAKGAFLPRGLRRDTFLSEAAENMQAASCKVKYSSSDKKESAAVFHVLITECLCLWALCWLRAQGQVQLLPQELTVSLRGSGEEGSGEEAGRKVKARRAESHGSSRQRGSPLPSSAPTFLSSLSPFFLPLCSSPSL